MKKFGLSKKERIKSKKEISLVYSKGSVLISKNKKLKVTFYFSKSDNSSSVKVAFGVHKKSGNAVWRNRVKRILRTAYRLNKITLIEECIQKKICLLVMISPFSFNQKKNKKIFLKDVEPDIIDLLNKLKTVI